MTDFPPIRLLRYHPALRHSAVDLGDGKVHFSGKGGNLPKSLGPSHRRLIGEYFYQGRNWAKRKELKQEMEEIARGRGYKLLKRTGLSASVRHLDFPSRKLRTKAAVHRKLEDRLSLVTSKVHLIPHNVPKDHSPSRQNNGHSLSPISKPLRKPGEWVGDRYHEERGGKKLQINLCLPMNVREETIASRQTRRKEFESFDISLVDRSVRHSKESADDYFSQFIPTHCPPSVNTSVQFLSVPRHLN